MPNLGAKYFVHVLRCALHDVLNRCSYLLCYALVHVQICGIVHVVDKQSLAMHEVIAQQPAQYAPHSYCHDQEALALAPVVSHLCRAVLHDLPFQVAIPLQVLTEAVTLLARCLVVAPTVQYPATSSRVLLTLQATLLLTSALH